jgi:iron(III) transport system substrate-binding protein
MKKRVLAAGIAAAALLASVLFVFAPARPRAAEKPAQRELVIYSPHPADITEYIVREFRQRTGIKATVISAGTGELIDMMKNAKDSSGADVFWGGGIESLETVKDYFDRYDSPEAEHILPEYKAAHGLWIPFSILPTVIIYNESLVPPAHVPRSWEDLLDPWFKNRLIMADPEKSGSSYTILATMLMTMGGGTGELFSGWPYVERLMGQIGHDGLASSSALVFRSVASGDFYAGITFENYVLTLKKNGADVGFCYPSEGTSAVPDGIALIKTAAHPEEAKIFIDFVLGRDVQKILPSRWQRRPVRDDIECEAQRIAEGSDTQAFIRYPVRESADARTAILSRWASLYARLNP